LSFVKNTLADRILLNNHFISS